MNDCQKNLIIPFRNSWVASSSGIHSAAFINGSAHRQSSFVIIFSMMEKKLPVNTTLLRWLNGKLRRLSTCVTRVFLGLLEIELKIEIILKVKSLINDGGISRKTWQNGSTIEHCLAIFGLKYKKSSIVWNCIKDSSLIVLPIKSKIIFSTFVRNSLVDKEATSDSETRPFGPVTSSIRPHLFSSSKYIFRRCKSSVVFFILINVRKSEMAYSYYRDQSWSFPLVCLCFR